MTIIKLRGTWVSIVPTNTNDKS